MSDSSDSGVSAESFVEPLKITSGEIPERGRCLPGERQHAGDAVSSSLLWSRRDSCCDRQRNRDLARRADRPKFGVWPRVRRTVLLQHDVGVRSGNPEGIHACSPWLLTVVGPFHGLGGDPHRQTVPVEARIGIPEVQVLRNQAGLHDHRRLDEPGHARRSLEVTDVGLDGADKQWMFGVTLPPVDRDRSGHLDRISHRGSGPVSLEIVHLRRREVRPEERGFDNLLERRSVGHRQSCAGPAVVDRGTANHRPDAVAVCLRFAQALQHDDPAPFAAHVAVGGGVEGLALAIRRQHHGIRTEFVHAAVQHGVDASCEGEVGLALLEIRDCIVNRDQGRGAGRIHSFGRPHETEHEGDSPRGAIHVRAAEGVETPRRLRRPGRVEDQHAILVSADTGVDAGSGALEAVRIDACVLERMPARLEHHALLRIEKLGFHRRNPEEGRVEAIDVVDKCTEAARRSTCGVVGEHLAQAARAGTRFALADRIPAALHETPEFGKARRARKAAGHADDRDGVAVSSRAMSVVRPVQFTHGSTPRGDYRHARAVARAYTGCRGKPCGGTTTLLHIVCRGCWRGNANCHDVDPVKLLVMHRGCQPAQEPQRYLSLHRSCTRFLADQREAILEVVVLRSDDEFDNRAVAFPVDRQAQTSVRVRHV